MGNYTYINDKGIVVADTADIKETVQEEFKKALGADISLEDSTPQGRLIDVETNARASVMENNALLANLFNVMESYGVFLDSLLANFGMYREGATSSKVKATISGVPNTVIPAGAQVSTENGAVFYLENSVTIPQSGEIIVTFLSKEKGKIECAAGALSKIIDGTLGWEAVINSSSAELGVERESDLAFKERFKAFGLFSGKSLLEDYESAINKIDNVKSSFVYDNPSSEVIIYDSVSINPHSIFCCVDGGSDSDVAKAIFEVKSAGCGYTGNKTVQVVDKVSSVSYPVSFSRPIEISICYKIVLDKGTSSSLDLVDSIKQAVVDYSNGKIAPFSGFQIGKNISPFESAAAINSYVSGITVMDLQVGLNKNELSTSEIDVHVNQVARVDKENIVVVING